MQAETPSRFSVTPFVHAYSDQIDRPRRSLQVRPRKRTLYAHL